MSTARFKNFSVIALVFLLIFQAPPGFSAQETAPAEPAVSAANSEAGEDLVRAYLQLQAQIHETRLAIEQTRQESERAAQRTAEVFAEQMKLVAESMRAEKTAMVEERQKDRDVFQSTGRIMLITLSSLAAAGLLAIVLTGYFHWRAVGRLTQMTSNWPESRAAGFLRGGDGLALNDTHLIPSSAVDESNARLTSVIDRLERRIAELESAARGSLIDHDGNGAAAAVIAPLPGDGGTATATATATSALSTGSGEMDRLLERGQELLDEDKGEEALTIFEEALRLEPNHTEALVKKGTALEKLRRPQEAIECYDRAISLDGSMTIAYLYKGGLFNRMERFSEAVECYEQALRTQETKAVV